MGTRQVSEHPFFCQLSGADRVRVHSGKSGALLWERNDAPRAIVPVGDVDRDGVDEVALGFPYAGMIEVRSGAGGGLLRRIQDPLVSDVNLFGHALAPAGDLFGSGSPALLVAAPQPWTYPIGTPGSPRSPGPGAVGLFSLGRRPHMSVLGGEATGDEYGADLAFLGDVDDDGRPEVAIGSTFGAPNGVVRVVSLDLHPQPGDAVPLPGRPREIHR